KAGDELLLMYPSANRDEAVFDAPERFDVGREPNPHVAFGFGTHFCLGAALARLEIRVMFEELLPRLRDPHLAPGVAPERIPNASTSRSSPGSTPASVMTAPSTSSPPPTPRHSTITEAPCSPTSRSPTPICTCCCSRRARPVLPRRACARRAASAGSAARWPT